jgi:glucose-1-phosphate thymidylyltransferase
MICCPEEIAYRRGFIDATQLAKLANRHGRTEYAAYLWRLAEAKT